MKPKVTPEELSTLTDAELDARGVLVVDMPPAVLEKVLAALEEHARSQGFESLDALIEANPHGVSLDRLEVALTDTENAAMHEATRTAEAAHDATLADDPDGEA